MFRIQQVFRVILLISGLHISIFAQHSLQLLNETRNDLQQKGMLTLTVWSGLNLFSGTYGWITTSDESRYFHQMNAGWNIVNLGLGLSGYFKARKENYLDHDLKTSIDYQRRVSNAFLFNSALNGTYITAGFLFKERAKNKHENEMMLRGFGNSLILQGGFLLLFDASSFILHNRNRKKHLNPIFLELSTKSTDIGVVIHF